MFFVSLCRRTRSNWVLVPSSWYENCTRLRRDSIACACGERSRWRTANQVPLLLTMHFRSSTFGAVRDYLPDSVIRNSHSFITVIATLVGRDSVAAQETRNDLDVTLQRNHVTDEERTAEIVTRLAHQILRWYTYLLHEPAHSNDMLSR